MIYKAIDCAKNCVDNGIRYVGPLFVLLAVALISGVVWVMFVDIIPFYSGDGLVYTSFTGISLVLISIFILGNIVFNYYMTIFTPPGSPPKVSADERTQIEQLIKREPEVRRGEGFSRFCKFCKSPKPNRAHHCHICKKCVSRMDHHCPWVSNCVGWGNHKYFVLFLTWLSIGCVFVAVTSFLPFQTTAFLTPSKSRHVFVDKGAVLFTFVISISIFFAVGMLLTWHIYLLLTAQTTIEFYYNRNRARLARLKGEYYHNEYDLGTTKNFQVFFGTGSIPYVSWLLPSTKPPPGDGITYLTRTEHLQSANLNHHYV